MGVHECPKRGFSSRSAVISKLMNASVLHTHHDTRKTAKIADASLCDIAHRPHESIRQYLDVRRVSGAGGLESDGVYTRSVDCRPVARKYLALESTHCGLKHLVRIETY